MEKKDSIGKQVVEAPAKALDATAKAGGKVSETVIGPPVKKVRDYWRILGPGLTTGASDDDPSGIATYSQTGAKYGFQLLWLSLFTFPLMAIVQEMCARIGLVTGRGLAANIRMNFPRPILYICTILLFCANTFNIGADLGALSEAIRLFAPINYYLLVILFATLILGLQIFTSYKNYAKYLKWLALVLISYIVTVFFIKNIDWSNVLRSTLIPHMTFDKNQIILICGILGTTISPYLFFWQTSQEVEEEKAEGVTSMEARSKEEIDREVKEMRVDIWSGMFLSNLAMFFIILTCGAVLNTEGITNIGTAAQAAEALRPLAGNATYFLFAIGILGVGLLGIPVLAGSSSYAISESFRWNEGLNKKLRQAYAFYGMIIISVIVGAAINFVGLDPIRALIYAAVLNGLVAPVVLVLIVILSSSKKVMQERKNGFLTKYLGWITVLLMVVVALATLYSIFI